jgi:hypothetical protein
MQSEAARDYWVRFRASFREQLERTSTDRFGDAWHSEPERTAFYVRDILPPVAADLKLQKAPELFRVDMAMGVASPVGMVPLIWIESENNADTATHEVRKLAALSGPVKVLITCCDWDDAPGAWKHGGKRNHYLEQWLSIVRSYAQTWPSASVFAIVVGEWNDTRLRFYATVLDSDGDITEDNTILFDKTVGPAPPSVDERFILDVTDHGPMTLSEMARRCDSSEARINSILGWAQTSRQGQRRYSIKVDGEKITVASKGDWRREIVERFRGPGSSRSAEQSA